MDAFYILQASLMTKYMTEPTNPYILAVFFIYVIYKALPIYVVAHINNTLEYYLKNDYNTSCIVTPYYCDNCNFKCSKKSDYTRHLSIVKHRRIKMDNEKAPKNAAALNAFTCNCGKTYMFTYIIFIIFIQNIRYFFRKVY